MGIFTQSLTPSSPTVEEDIKADKAALESLTDNEPTSTPEAVADPLAAASVETVATEHLNEEVATEQLNEQSAVAQTEETGQSADTVAEEPAAESLEAVAATPTAEETPAASLEQVEQESTDPVEAALAQLDPALVQEATAAVAVEDLGTTEEATPSAESPIQEAAPSEETPSQEASPVEEAQVTQTQDPATALHEEQPVIEAQGRVRSPAVAQMHQLMVRLEKNRGYDRSVSALHHSLDQLQLVTNLSQVAKERNLSAPLVATFNAIPGFMAALESFPAQDQFNTVPEHVTDPNNVAALESLDSGVVASADTLAVRTSDLAGAFAGTLNGLGVTVQNLMDQLHADREDLDASDVTDEVLASLPVCALSNKSFVDVLTTLEAHLRAVEVFNADDLRAYPEKIKEEAESLQTFVTELGGMFGLDMGEHGLVDAPKSDGYEPDPASFGDLQIDKAGLLFLLSKADSVLDALKAIADRKEALVGGVNTEVTDMPTTLYSDDVSYGRVEHVTLLSCYTTLVTKLVREAILAVSMVLTTVDAVLDIDDGLDD